MRVPVAAWQVRLQTALFVYFKKGSPYLIDERRVPELIPILGSQPAGDVSHKPDGIIGCHYFSSGLQIPPQPLKRAATSVAAW